jgi:hypothetical protein
LLDAIEMLMHELPQELEVSILCNHGIKSFMIVLLGVMRPAPSVPDCVDSLFLS